MGVFIICAVHSDHVEGDDMRRQVEHHEADENCS
jgi:hypothetical protein